VTMFSYSEQQLHYRLVWACETVLSCIHGGKAKVNKRLNLKNFESVYSSRADWLHERGVLRLNTLDALLLGILLSV
jgi:hypothetical protein